jgi:glycerol-3-phosphate dehydrogenase
MSLVLTAVQHGAVVANYVEVVQLHKAIDPVRGVERICAATVKDKMTGEEWKIRCRVRISRFMRKYHAHYGRVS